jgi:hypothetical protein
MGHEDYNKLLKRWTRNDQIIKKLDTPLRVHATWFSPEFIAAFVAQKSHLFRLPAQEREQLSKQLMGEWEVSYSFVVAAATSDHKTNDFDQQNTVWRVALAGAEGREVTPSEVLREKISATNREILPYIGRFHRVYRFKFPRALADGRPLIDPSSRDVTLHFAGPLGKAKLRWRIR